MCNQIYYAMISDSLNKNNNECGARDTRRHTARHDIFLKFALHVFYMLAEKNAIASGSHRQSRT